MNIYFWQQQSNRAIKEVFKYSVCLYDPASESCHVLFDHEGAALTFKVAF